MYDTNGKNTMRKETLIKQFTITLWKNGIPITQLSTLLGHADTAMTWHYICKQKPDAQTADIIKSVLG